MMTSLDLVLLMTLACVGHVQGYPTGPPPSACENMMPNHGFNATASDQPPYYLLEVVQASTRPDSTPCHNVDEPVQLRLSGQNGENFRGFLVRLTNTPAPGRFSQSEEDYKILDCLDQTENAISHKEHSDKTEAIFNVTSTEEVELSFRVTVVQEQAVFKELPAAELPRIPWCGATTGTTTTAGGTSAGATSAGATTTTTAGGTSTTTMAGPGNLDDTTSAEDGGQGTSTQAGTDAGTTAGDAGTTTAGGEGTSAADNGGTTMESGETTTEKSEGLVLYGSLLGSLLATLVSMFAAL